MRHSRERPKTRADIRSEPVRVALAGFSLHGLHARVIQGIQAYAHTHRWTIYNANNPNALLEMEMNKEYFSGIIAVVVSEASAQRFRAFPCPVINVSDVDADGFGFPTVIPDNAQVGTIAADYFLARGYRNFAVHVPPGVHPYRYINARAQGFIDRLHAHGFGYFGIADMFDDKERARLVDTPHTILKFRDLPRPCAVFCCDDYIGEHLCFVAGAMGVRIPEQLSVLGVDNFELLCDMTNPPLSSIAVDGERIGRRAARMLHDLMTSAGVSPATPVLIPPGEVIARDSSRFSAIDDPWVARAQQYILDHCGERINVRNVVPASGTNRRYLERAFRRRFGTSVLEQINRARVERARRLLTDTDLPIYRVAEASGFRDAYQMGRVFHRLREPAPSSLRRTDTRRHG